MITDPELSKVVRSFLEDGVDRMPDRVYTRAMDAIPAAHRKRGPWWRRRVTFVASFGRLAAVAALAVVLVLGSFSLLTLGGGVGLSPTTPPRPTDSPSPSPVVSTPPSGATIPTGGPVAGLLGDEVLGAGRYEVGAPFRIPFTVALPDATRFGEFEGGRVSFYTELGDLEVFVPEAVIHDPCHPAGDPVLAPTVDELVDGLTSMVGVSATTPTQTTVAGRPARMFVLTNTIDTATQDCTREAMLPLFTYAGSSDPAATNGGTRQVVWVVDIDRQPLLIVGDGWGDVARSDLEALVATIAIP
jgi:hypothetical protein